MDRRCFEKITVEHITLLIKFTERVTSALDDIKAFTVDSYYFSLVLLNFNIRKFDYFVESEAEIQRR